MKRNIIKWIMCLIILIYFTSVSTAQIVIVVNKNNPVKDISFSELKKMYLGKITFFSDGESIVLAEYKDLKEKFYDDLLGWSLIKYKKHWMKMIFSGESSIAPKEFVRSDEILEFVEKHKGAIAFIELAEVDDKIKVLTIDGKNPAGKDYIFK